MSPKDNMHHSIRDFAAPAYIADILLTVVIFILGTGMANPTKNMIDNFWIGPIALMIPSCALYLLYPSKENINRPMPWLVVLAAVIYIFMIIFDMLFIDTSFSPYFIRRSEFMIIVAAIMILLQNASIDIAQKSLRISIVLGTIFILADYFFPPLTQWLNRVMSVERAGYLATHRAFGFFINPNAAGAFLSLATAVCVRGAARPTRIFFYVVSLIGILATVSRGSLILWALVILLTELLVVRDNKIRVSFVPIFVGGLIVLALFAITQNLSFESMKWLNLSNDTATRLTTVGDGSSMERTELIRYAWNQFLSHPIFGLGVGYDYNWAMPRPVHNIYLLMLVEHGVIGLVWLGIFLFSLKYSPAPFNIIAPTLIMAKGLFNHSLFNEVNDAMLIAMFATGAGWTALSPSQLMRNLPNKTRMVKAKRRYGPAPRPVAEQPPATTPGETA